MQNLLLRDLIGLDEQAAIKLIKEKEGRVRVLQRDDQAFAGTCDLDRERVNLVVKDGVVVRAGFG